MVRFCASFVLQHVLKEVLVPKTVLQVQNLIERCLQLHMNQKEVVDTLSFQAKIEPSFTELGNYLLRPEVPTLLNLHFSLFHKLIQDFDFVNDSAS